MVPVQVETGYTQGPLQHRAAAAVEYYLLQPLELAVRVVVAVAPFLPVAQAVFLFITERCKWVLL